MGRKQIFRIRNAPLALLPESFKYVSKYFLSACVQFISWGIMKSQVLK